MGQSPSLTDGQTSGAAQDVHQTSRNQGINISEPHSPSHTIPQTSRPQGQTSSRININNVEDHPPSPDTPAEGNADAVAGDYYTDHAGYRRDRTRYGPLVFSYRQLNDATNGFSLENFLGEGGFGSVFKGKLTTGQTVAIKRLDSNTNNSQGELEFLTEVLVLSIVWHHHIIKMIGYCCELGDNRLQHLIVYEFMPFGSLEYRLYDVPCVVDPLDWNTRMKIAAGVAKALSFLHHESIPPAVYRDLKPSNILLARGLYPVLSDFGLLRFGVEEGSSMTVGLHDVVMGTLGYCAPEHHSTGQLKTPSDVYSFGVLLLELITGMRALDEERGAAAKLLVDWETVRATDGSKENIADPGLRGQVSGETICKAVALAEACVADDPYARPDMTEVVHMMGNLLTLTSESSASSFSLDQLWRGGETRGSVPADPDATASKKDKGKGVLIEEEKDPDAVSNKDKGKEVLIVEEGTEEEDEALEIRRVRLQQTPPPPLLEGTVKETSNSEAGGEGKVAEDGACSSGAPEGGEVAECKNSSQTTTATKDNKVRGSEEEEEEEEEEEKDDDGVDDDGRRLDKWTSGDWIELEVDATRTNLRHQQEQHP